MPNVTTVEKFPKASFTQDDVEQERALRLSIPGVISSEITSDNGDWVLTTVLPGGDDAAAAAPLAAAVAAALPAAADITGALKAAVRLNEIGDASPYRLSFAGKGKSGASFGFMQGDLAAGQPAVRDAFRSTLSAAGFPDEQIGDLLQRLSAHLISDPLTPEESAQINAALSAPAGRALVDAMDGAIFQQVCGDVQKCVQAAMQAGRQVAPKAQVYMALWINMSGQPTTLLKWLAGNAVALAKPVPAPPMLVDGPAMETYLHATNYFSENQGNFAHIAQCAAAGMNAVAVV